MISLEKIVDAVNKRVENINTTPIIEQQIKDLEQQIKDLEQQKRLLDYDFTLTSKALIFWGNKELINRKIEYIEKQQGKVQNFASDFKIPKEEEIQILKDFLEYTLENKKPCHDYNRITY